MLLADRAREMDVTNRIDVTDPDTVCEAIMGILGKHYPPRALARLPRVIADFARLYRGEYPGYHACDVGYHNIQHVLDVTLAMARLIDGYQQCHGDEAPIPAQLAMAGVVTAIFHDSGYIRKLGDRRHSNGAEYTRIHVSRSSRFMGEYLPTVGLDDILPTCQRIVHFTGYEVNPADIEVPDDRERVVGWLLGTADLIAQMADVAYLEKCRDQLYPEFVEGGMAEGAGKPARKGVIYRSPAHLMQSTPNFIRSAIQVRLDGYFHAYHRYAAQHFGGPNLYMEAIEQNCARLESLLARNDPALLLGDALSPN
ncbi:MAG: hypothetical protein V2J89_14075 [Halieaceae bacterium]|nr:hypothetical protein [Halieaceae bacterium]